MRGWWTRAGTMALGIAAACAAPAGRADDDVVAAPAAPRPERQAPVMVIGGAGGAPGIDLAAHVDINVVLPTNQWRIGGGVQNLVIAGGGRLVIDGNLTIGGEPIAAQAERVRKADEVVLARLRQTQRDRLAHVAADQRIPAARRRAFELATEADIRRVMAEVAALRDRYEGRRANLGDDDWKAFQKDVQLCRRAIADPFGDDSLVAAVQAGIEPAP